MAIYRQIHISFWQDDFILELTPEEKFFYLYLMTNSKTTQCGVYELPKKIIEFETGYNRETVEKLLNRFVEYGKIKYNDKHKELIILNWMKHNQNKSEKVMQCIRKELKDVKTSEFLELFQDACIQYEYPIHTVSIPCRNNNNNQYQNNNNNESDAVWEHYKTKLTKLGKTRRKTDGKLKHINARLNDGFSVDEMKAIIDNVFSDSFMLGKNDRGKMYIDIDNFLKNTEKAEKWLDRPREEAPDHWKIKEAEEEEATDYPGMEEEFEKLTAKLGGH